MRYTSIPTIPGPLAPGGTVGSDFVAASGIPADDVRMLAASAADYTTVLISSGTNKLFLEPGRSVYRLDTEVDAPTVDLTTIEGGADGRQIALLQGNLLHAIVVKDDNDLDADDQLIVSGGDFTLRNGDIILLKYKKSLLRWIETGRYWPSKFYVDATADPRLATISELEALKTSLQMSRIAGSTYYTIQHLMDVFHFSGWISGGAVADAGSETIDVAAGTGSIRAADSDTAELMFFDWSASTGLAVPTDTTRYVGIEYNAGSPRVVLKTTDAWDYNTDFPLATVVNTSGALAITTTKVTASHGPQHEVRYTLLAAGAAIAF